MLISGRGGWAPFRALAFVVVAFAAAPSRGHQQVASADDLGRLSIEELAQIKVTSVSKSEEPVSQAAAAVFVITNDAIRRSGANSVPEILRLAPNLHVARLDANTYAISARGFNHNSGTANKLLVLIDGRAIYSPLFSGTFWDAQKTFIDDIDRIEVISGPAGTLWGANAVNGVINIITKDSLRTRGWSVDARAGSLDQRLAARYGGNLGATGTFRAYGLGLQLGAMKRATGESADDSWNHLQGGFRADWQRAGGILTLQSDLYRGTGIGRAGALSSGEISGGNLSAAWERELTAASSVRVLAYADRTRRVLVSGIDARVDQFAVEAQYDVAFSRHAVVVGAGYRMTEDRFKRGPGTVFLDPAERRLGFANVFAQDSIRLGDALKLTLGVKLEDETYRGLEVMPDARLAWIVSETTTLWTSVARAVRTPSRFDTDLVNTNILNGNRDFQSEELIAYEAGYRALLTPQLSLALSAFYNSYDSLRTIEASGPAVFPLIIRNNMRGHTYGIEAWADLSVRDRWRLSLGAGTLEKNLTLVPGTRDVFGVAFAGNDPSYHWSLRSSTDLPGRFSFDVFLRNVGELESPRVASYLEADARLAWEQADELTLSLEGNNLLHDQHLEFVNPSLPPAEVPRSFTLAVRWTP